MIGEFTMIMKKILAAGWSVLTLLGVYLMMFTEFVSLGDYLGFQLVSDFINAGVAMGLYSDHPEFILLYMTLILVFVVLWIISLVKLKTTHFFEKLVNCKTKFHFESLNSTLQK